MKEIENWREDKGSLDKTVTIMREEWKPDVVKN